MTGQTIPPTSEQDMRERWLPTPAAVSHAMALLAAEPRADLAAIPMVQPGKTFGWWETGQAVETVAGALFIGVNSFDASPDGHVPGYAWARNAASDVARAALGDRPGTVGWATVDRDGNVAVFEDVAR